MAPPAPAGPATISMLFPLFDAPSRLSRTILRVLTFV